MIKEKKSLKLPVFWGFFLRHIIYRGTKIRMVAVLSSEITQSRPWSTERKNCQPKILYPEKISFKTENEIKIFLDMERLKEFISS